MDPSSVEIVEYALPNVEEDVQAEARPAIVESPKDDDVASIVTPDDAANSSILKKTLAIHMGKKGMDIRLGNCFYADFIELLVFNFWT